jgi:hypothetical protein
LANRFLSLPLVATQSGTVTLATLDLAVHLGFQHIHIVGADFSYPHSKAYARGTYLDSRFYPTANRLAPAEQSFTALLCHGTTVLDRYYKAAKQQIASYRGVDIVSDSARRLQSPQLGTFSQTDSTSVDYYQPPHPAKDFLPWYREQLEAALKGNVTPELVTSCLPLGAWAQKKSGKMKKSNVFMLLKLAYNLISRYN